MSVKKAAHGLCFGSVELVEGWPARQKVQCDVRLHSEFGEEIDRQRKILLQGRDQLELGLRRQVPQAAAVPTILVEFAFRSWFWLIRTKSLRVSPEEFFEQLTINRIIFGAAPTQRNPLAGSAKRL